MFASLFASYDFSQFTAQFVSNYFIRFSAWINSPNSDLFTAQFNYLPTSGFTAQFGCDLQAEAVIRLHEYKAIVNEEQAKKILDLLHDIHDPKTKHLLLIVRKRNGLPGELEYCPEKMSQIKAKLLRFKVINGV